MGGLTGRLRRLESRRPRADICPEHIRAGTPADMAATLRAFSPYQEDRDAYRAEQDALANTPPCGRCGWRPMAIYIETPGHWGQGGGDAVA